MPFLLINIKKNSYKLNFSVQTFSQHSVHIGNRLIQDVLLEQVAGNIPQFHNSNSFVSGFN